MGLYEFPLFMSLLGFGMETYVSQLPYVWYYVVVKIRFKYASPRGPMCFRDLMFNWSGPCELLFILFYCLLDLSCGELNVISLYFLCCSVDGTV